MTNHPQNPFAFDLSPRSAKIVAVSLALGTAVVDLFTPANVVPAMFYPVAVAICLWARSFRFLWAIAAFAAILSLTSNLIVSQPMLPADSSLVFINQLISAVTTMAVAVLVHHAIHTRNLSDSQRLALERQNTDLEGVTHELGQREEEIIRQNEELQSQTEELERQTEELRSTNEELMGWEKRLEQLLELARTLTAETSRSDVFSKLCESLGLVAESQAAAILERQGDELRLECHHGFGPEGAQTASIPFAQSFSSKVISLGQTGYLEDIRLRPDLQIPQPKQGDPFRAVLSTPVRVGGRTIGTIEAYSAASRRWSPAEVAMIESLAVQASASIQSAELVDEIRKERRRFEAAFRTVPFGMAVAEDPGGEHIRLNPAAAALFGLPTDENVSQATPSGARLWRQVHRGDRQVPTAELPLARALRGEEVHGEELDVRPLKGAAFTLMTSAAPIFDSQGHVRGAVAAFVDITSQRTLQRELELRRREAEEASVRKTRFLAAVSHDIRTPANAINLMAEILKRIAGDPARAAEVAETAVRLQANTHALMELVGDVLDVARFDSGRIELVESEFSLAELIEQECKQLSPLARDKGIDLGLESLSRAIWLRTDRIKLGRVLGNLIGNAIKFTDNGSVRVGAVVEPLPQRRLLIRVRDTGIGISHVHQSSIFDEFSQLNNPARDRMKGNGLGLAICKRLVELMGGSISVYSGEGQGSTFTVDLPASLLALRTEISPPSAPGPTAGAIPAANLTLKILLVEDHSATRDGTARLLREHGATVIEAPDATTALKCLQQESFDVMLLDMMLPDLDGREVLRSLEKQRPQGLKGILVLTGDLTEARVAEVKSLGADGLIQKPVDVPKLLQTLRSFL